MSANWGRDIWDQYDRVSSHLDQGIEFVKRIREFVKERARAEETYAKELRKLAKNFVKRKEDDVRYTDVDAFYKLVKEVDDTAGQHEVVSENLLASVYENLKKLQHDLTKEKRQHMQDGSKQMSIYNQALGNLEKAKKKYELATIDAEKAQLIFDKASQDMNMTRSQVEKHRLYGQQRSDLAEEAKGNYLVCLDQTNHLQRDHFFTRMPEVFKSFQRMEETRIDNVKKLLHQQLDVDMQVQPILGRCRDNIKAAADAVDSVKDSVTFSEDNRTGYNPPEDKNFEEYTSASKAKTVKREREPPKTNTEDFSHLPPAKRKKKLQAKVKELEDAVKKEASEHTALEKMYQVYSANPSLGDKNVVQQQLGKIAEKLDRLNEELYKFENYLAQAEGKEPPPKRSSVQPQRTSVAAPSTGGGPTTPTNVQQPVQASPAPEPQPSVDEWDDEPGEPTSIAFCTIMYDFTQSNEGELSVKAGERLEVLENDNSGWLHVRRGTDEGYIPLSYAEVQK